MPNSLTQAEIDELVAAAAAARGNAYAPYSKFKVGAAVLAEDGRIFTGVNVENASYGLTVCAERNAVFAAVTAGKHPLRLRAVAVVTGISPPAMPCGACRQVLYEFGAQASVICANDRGERRIAPVAALLPDAFGPSDLA